MRILVLSPRQCWPQDSGARLREYHLARALGQRTELSWLGFARERASGPDYQNGEEALPFCRTVRTVAPPTRYTPAKLLLGLLGKKPVTVLNYETAEMATALRGLLSERVFDIVQMEALQMAGYSRILEELRPTPLIVYDWHNIESELMERYGSKAPSPARRMYARIAARQLRMLEDEVLRAADGHLVCSERELAILQRRAPAAQVRVIPNGVDTEYFRETAAAPPPDDTHPAGARDGRFRLLFVGSMDYHANIDAAVELATSIWPPAAARLPGCELTIVGSNPAVQVRRLASASQVTVTGGVPDIRSYYREAFAVAVPLRTGSGTRLKVLEAMAAGVPVISTRLGVEGLDLRSGEDVLIAESCQDWLEALGTLWAEPARWRAVAAAARALAVRKYDWREVGGQLYEMYCAMSGAGNAG